MLASAKAVARRMMPSFLYHEYRKRRIRWEISRYRVRDVTHVYGDNKLRIRLVDSLAEGWYDRDWDEPSELAFLRVRGILVPEATVFEFGAHQGVMALMLARCVGDSGRVVAVEADAHNASAAVVNCDLNNADNITVIHAAGAESPGTTSFLGGLNGHVDATTSIKASIQVPAVSVDQLAKEYGVPDLVYIDVEGYEGHVIRGAVNTLANHRTSFFAEIHESLVAFGDNPKDIVSRFNGFDTYIAVDDIPFAPFSTVPSGRFFLIAIPVASGA